MHDNLKNFQNMDVDESAYVECNSRVTFKSSAWSLGRKLDVDIKTIHPFLLIPFFYFLRKSEMTF